MSKMKNVFDGISKRRELILSKLAAEFIDGVTFDPSFSDEEIDYLLLKIQEEIDLWFAEYKPALNEENED